MRLPQTGRWRYRDSWRPLGGRPVARSEAMRRLRALARKCGWVGSGRHVGKRTPHPDRELHADIKEAVQRQDYCRAGPSARLCDDAVGLAMADDCAFAGLARRDLQRCITRAESQVRQGRRTVRDGQCAGQRRKRPANVLAARGFAESVVFVPPSGARIAPVRMASACAGAPYV